MGKFLQTLQQILFVPVRIALERGGIRHNHRRSLYRAVNGSPDRSQAVHSGQAVSCKAGDRAKMEVAIVHQYEPPQLAG